MKYGLGQYFVLWCISQDISYTDNLLLIMWPQKIVRMYLIENFTTAPASAWEKNYTAERKFYIFLIKNYNCTYQSYRRSLLALKGEHPAL
jgi:hypothetical protein